MFLQDFRQCDSFSEVTLDARHVENLVFLEKLKQYKPWGFNQAVELTNFNHLRKSGLWKTKWRTLPHRIYFETSTRRQYPWFKYSGFGFWFGATFSSWIRLFRGKEETVKILINSVPAVSQINFYFSQKQIIPGGISTTRKSVTWS